MSEEKGTTTCIKKYSKCRHSKRIKLILQRYNKIACDKRNKSDNELQNGVNELIQNISSNTTQYSTVELLNDFFHIKYDHKTNNDPNQFNLFHKYLLGKKAALKCDVSTCKSAKRHFNRRNRSFNTVQNEYLLCLVCRIHTYFIHSYDTYKLTRDETKYIEKQLNQLQYTESNGDMYDDKKLQLIMTNKRKNVSSTVSALDNSKFITADCKCLNYAKIVRILKSNNLVSDANCDRLANAFDSYGYQKQQLVDDLCEMLANGERKDILLSQILRKEMKYKSLKQRQAIYTIILSKYVQKNDLNNRNFIKILQVTAHKLYPKINCDKIAEIAQKANLNGNTLVKGSQEFLSTAKLANVFKALPNWDRKHWQKIYIHINKWKFAEFHDSSATISYSLKLSETKISEDKISETDYIDMGTDAHIINQFCVIANTTKDIAAQFLIQSQWNLVIAINKFYAASSTMFVLQNTNKETIVYNHGVAFWYWNQQKPNKLYVKKRFNNLKQEILYFKHFSLQQWLGLVDECQMLIKTNKIKKISSNGNHANIYGIQKDEPITNQHVHAIKLYTDYDWICKIFCQAFRLKKVSETQYERVESVKCRNKKVANWARLLTESVQSYGEFCTDKTRYYRGIGMEFVFKKFITKFNVPLSTTTDFRKATEFAQGSLGLVLELRRYNEFLPGLDCSALSEFDHEKEVLFFGTDAILQIRCVFQWYGAKWASYRHYINAIQIILNIANGAAEWNHTNDIKDVVGYILPDLYGDTKPLPPYIQSLLDYHLENLPDVICYDLRELSHDYAWVQHIFVKRHNIPHIANMSNLFRQCNKIKLTMPNDNVMDAECCQSIISEVANLRNKNVAIEFKWTEFKSLNEIKASFTKCISSQMISIEINIDEIRNSVTILPSAEILNGYTMQTRFFPSIRITESSKLTVSAFIHQLEKQCNLWCVISADIVKICYKFYDCVLELPTDKTTPFTILFAIFGLQCPLSVEGWELLSTPQQCEYLQVDKIDTLRKRKATATDLIDTVYDFSRIPLRSRLRIQNQTMIMLSQYHKKVTVLKSKFVKQWSGTHLVISLFHYLINKADVSVKRDSKTWQFMEYFRRYCGEMEYNGSAFLRGGSTMMDYGSLCIKNVCEQYGLISDSFSIIKKSINKWSKKCVSKAKRQKIKRAQIKAQKDEEERIRNKKTYDKYVRLFQQRYHK